jgi:hypothetical protein
VRKGGGEREKGRGREGVHIFKSEFAVRLGIALAG